MKASMSVCAFILASTAAFAGQEPYVAVVGDDRGILQEPADANDYRVIGVTPGSLQDFYLEPKLYQEGFTHPQTFFPGEAFRANNALVPTDRVNTEVCDNKYDGESPIVNRNVRARTGSPADYFEWDVVLPKDPLGSINLVLQCGLTKPNEISVVGPLPADNCAGEAGETVLPSCTRRIPGSGQYIRNAALPRLTVTAYPGPFNSSFVPFHLTAIRNPSNYVIPADSAVNSQALQVLDGGNSVRVTLKACMPKTILMKLPIEGYMNALGQTEAALVAGDRIKVRMDVPSASTVDFYCNAYSAKLMGLGDPISLISNESESPEPPNVLN